MGNFYHKIFFIILTLRALDIFCFRHGCCCCCSLRQAKAEANQFFSISREYLSKAIKIILPNNVFDFTAGRLSKNVKILPRGSMVFVCNKGTQGGGLQKHNIYHICIFYHQKQDF